MGGAYSYVLPYFQISFFKSLISKKIGRAPPIDAPVTTPAMQHIRTTASAMLHLGYPCTCWKHILINMYLNQF